MLKNSHKNHHFIPQYYFRSFSTDKKSICLLVRDSGRLARKAPIKGQASAINYYGNENVEQTLSKIESHYSSALNEIVGKKSILNLSPLALKNIHETIMVQKSRTSAARERISPAMDVLYQRHWMNLVKNDAQLDEETKRGFMMIARNLKSDPIESQLIGMKSSARLAKTLKIHKTILIENMTSEPFIFGDAPVILLNPYLKRVKKTGVLGTLKPGIIIFYPLSPRLLIMIYDFRVYGISKNSADPFQLTSLQDVNAINKFQIHNAQECVYFSDTTNPETIKRMWHEEKHKFTSQCATADEYAAYDNSGSYQGIVFHSFEPQLPFFPKLKFLNYDEYSRSEHNWQYEFEERFA